MPVELPADTRAHQVSDEIVGRDVLRAVVPFAGAGVVVYAAITDPAHPARVALLAGAAGLFAVWAVRPNRMPPLALAAGVLPAVVLAKGSGDLDVGLFLLSLLAIVVTGWEASPTVVVIVVLAALAVPPMFVLLRPGDIDPGIWFVGVAFPGLMSWLFRRQEELRAQVEQARRQVIEQSVADERRRIARDVHDLVGHGLAAVLLQIASARHVLRRDPDEAEEALASAEDAGRRSLTELRRTVALLRDAGDEAVAAVPGLTDLTHLVEESRAAGLTVMHRTTGAVEAVDPMIGLTVYRIAQEALLNAARHAPSARTLVTVDVRADDVELRVESRPAAPARNGRPEYGLTGMRERAGTVGGTLQAGPDGDGWLVRCTVPIAEPPARTP